jgi:hypothetical protein
MLRKSWSLLTAVALLACSGTGTNENQSPASGSTGGSSGSGGSVSGTGGSGTGGSETGGSGTTGGSAGAEDSGAGETGGSVETEDAAVDDGPGNGGPLPEGGAVGPSDAGTMFGPIPPGMTRIFDGKTLDGWVGNPAIWSVNTTDEAIYGKTDNGGQLIKSVGTYDTFRVIVTERMVATNNHLGICLWGGNKTPWGYDACIVLIGPQGSLWDYKSGGGVFRGTGDNSIRFMWHQVEILADAATGRILAAVNGKQTTDYTKAGRGMKGPIGMQAHAKALEVEYKDIWIDPAPKEMKLLTLK